MLAFRMDVSALDKLRSYNLPIVNISMDDRQAYWGLHKPAGFWGGTSGLIGHIDLATTTTLEAVAWYQAEGCPVIFLPEASDPTFFHSFPKLDKEFDVAFVGSRYRDS